MDKTTKQLPAWAQDTLATLPPLLDYREAATTARCSIKTLRRRVDMQQLKTVRNGRRVLISRSDLIAFLLGGA